LDEDNILCGVGSDLIQPRIVHPANRFLIQKVMNGLKLINGGLWHLLAEIAGKKSFHL